MRSTVRQTSRDREVAYRAHRRSRPAQRPNTRQPPHTDASGWNTDRMPDDADGDGGMDEA